MEFMIQPVVMLCVGDVKWKTILNVFGIYSVQIPSLEQEGASVLDEYYWLNKHDPNYSLCRATINRGARCAYRW